MLELEVRDPLYFLVYGIPYSGKKDPVFFLLKGSGQLSNYVNNAL